MTLGMSSYCCCGRNHEGSVSESILGEDKNKNVCGGDVIFRSLVWPRRRGLGDVVVVAVVLTETCIGKYVVTGQAPVRLELTNTCTPYLAKNTNKFTVEHG